MREARRLVTSIDLDTTAGPEANTERRMSIDALLELELVDGRRVTLLDDRGWASSGPSDLWSRTSLEDLAHDARTVVGPDEPPEGCSSEDAAAMHWDHLAATARNQGVRIAPEELAALPHDVEASADIQARLARSAQ
ncbi:hypothetical protein [Kineococcus xinjiangensis]|nr:hypothetical protein [Kineococcus xinjiangensis]